MFLLIIVKWVYITYKFIDGRDKMKWGILATGNIAKKFASTINEMSKENEQLVAVGSRNIESAKAFLRSMISQDIMIRMKHWLKIRMWMLFM